MSSVVNFYQGKNVLVSGTTGFLGKVILEKVMRCFPQINTIYVLIRVKKGESVNDRFSKQVMQSPLFERLRRQLGADFDKFVQSKIRLVQGDLLQENLGLSPQDRQTLVDNLHILINSAASVDFNAKLSDAIDINVKGTLRMFDLAKECRRLENFIHISTCYVNSDKLGHIEEEIYDTDDDAEEMIANLIKIPLDELEQRTKEILGPYPNTYVFTKAAVERIIQKRRPKNLTISIVRPSIIGAAFRDPYPGWVENVTASSAIFLLGGIGMLKYIQGNDQKIGDVVPVDFVSDYVIVASAFMANTKQLHIFHCGTSARNPMAWGFARDSVEQYWSANPPEKRVTSPKIHLIPNTRILRFYQFRRRIPIEIGLRLSKITGAKKLEKNMERALKIYRKAEQIGDVFAHFVMNEWIFENKKCETLMSMILDEEQDIFLLDTTLIDWYDYMLMYHYGLHKYILGENVEPPEADDILSRQRLTHFNDIQWALQQGKPFKQRSPASYRNMVLNSPSVQNEINRQVEERLAKFQGGAVTSQKSQERERLRLQITREAEGVMREMISNYNMGVIRMFGWTLHKIFKTIYEKVVVDDSVLNHLKHHDAKLDGPLVLIPTHRSYIDFLIVSYIFFAQKIQVPHIAAAEDFLKMALVPRLLRASGAFFLRRKMYDATATLYKAILYEYIQRILIDDCYLEFFIEGTRSRNFKMQEPKFGILGTIADAVYEGKIVDAMIVPITINYERVLEGDTYPYELMGEEKIRESLMRLMRASTTLLQNYGKIYIEVCEPISLKKYAQRLLEREQIQDRKIVVERLGYHITHTLTENLIVQPTSMVAAVLMMHRKGLMEQLLVKNVEWLASELIKRNCKIGSVSELQSASIAVRNALKLMDGLIQQSRKSVLEMSVQPGADFKTTLMLNYYRNGLIHVFFPEAIVAVALCSFGWKRVHEGAADADGGATGVPIDDLVRETQFLQSFLRSECVHSVHLEKRDACVETIQVMEQRGVIAVRDGGRVFVRDDKIVAFMGSLIWPLTEAYRSTLLYLFTLQQKHYTIQFPQLQQYVQWFAKELHDDRIVEHLESCSLDTLKNAVRACRERGLIKARAEVIESGKSVEDVVRTAISEEELVKLEKHFSRFIKGSYITNSNNPVDIARRTVLADYPFMSKL